jgi:Zn-dependent protease with chaperone function
MDFFAAQAAARRRTAVLLAWFALALLGTAAAIWAGLGAVLALAFPSQAHLAFSPLLAAWVGAVVGAVTLAGTAIHHARLAAGGGHAVARLLGGAPVDRRTADPGERRLVNVVEEMAVAAGLPVPALYVLPADAGINAFAAGFAPDRSVVAVTRGALDELTRDELQGVVAHELSHVLNGDARLNLQLLALVGGLTVLAAVGRSLARAVGDTGLRRSRARRGGSGPVLAAGLVVWLAGSVGALFGRILRAAVSRQRELLADAAAVQFTRNPEGLAGALAKIARTGSAVSSAFAPEAAHLFFANALASRWLATHPPVEERVRRLLPGGLPRPARPAPPARAGGLSAAPSALVASVGHPGPANLHAASRAIASLPAELAEAAREPAGAAALARALLADPDPAVRAIQLRALPDPALRAEVARLAGALVAVSRAGRAAALDLAAAALAALPPGAAAALVADLRTLAGADGRTTLHEWTVVRVVSRRLAPARRGRGGARLLEDVQVDVLDLLSALAWVGARDEAAAQAALDAALGVLGLRGWRVLPRDRIAGPRLEAALARLETAAPALQARLLEACAACVVTDGRVLPAEGELLRAIAASFGVPVPPIGVDAAEVMAGTA